MLNIDLFENIENNNVLELLKCLSIKTKTYKKGAYIIKSGQKIDSLCIVLEGCVNQYKLNSKNESIIVDKYSVNDIFAHNIICLGRNVSPCDFIAEKSCEILFLPFEKIINPCSKLCSYHIQAIKNLMKMISKRNSMLNDKIDIIAQKTTREKILALLKTYENYGELFSIPYSREGMAKYLCVDRSALSRELSRMRDEGILKFRKNYFELIKQKTE